MKNLFMPQLKRENTLCILGILMSNVLNISILFAVVFYHAKQNF